MRGESSFIIPRVPIPVGRADKPRKSINQRDFIDQSLGTIIATTFWKPFSLVEGRKCYSKKRPVDFRFWIPLGRREKQLPGLALQIGCMSCESWSYGTLRKKFVVRDTKSLDYMRSNSDTLELLQRSFRP